MSPAGLAVTSVTRLPFPSNWFLDNTSAINCIPGLGLPDQIRSMTQLTEYLLWQSSAPAVPEEDQNISLVDSHDIISPLGRFLSVPELQNILGEYQKTDTCYFIALSKVTLNVHKDMNFFFFCLEHSFTLCLAVTLLQWFLRAVWALLWVPLVFSFSSLGCPTCYL